MQIGVTFPQREIRADPGAIREFVQAVEELGYDHLVIADHVLGADPAHHPLLENRPYTHESIVHEIFALMAYVASCTQRLGLLTGVLILPQRQTALVAKQAAEIDFLSEGRLRLGIGTGWNHVEYEALGEDFHNRGRRSGEQIALMRSLWSKDTVNFEGLYHRVTHAGLNPPPVQRPIPVWLGGGRDAQPGNRAENVVRRVAKIADGWLPQFPTDDTGAATLERMRSYAREAGRDPAQIGIEGRIRTAEKQPEDWVMEARWWEGMGASHINVDTRWADMTGAEEHLEVARRFKEAVSG